MTEIPETDEARLRARLHTIGGVIEGRIDAGRDGLFEPRRTARLSGWRLRGVVVGGAVAVVVAIVVAISVTRGPAAPTTRVMAGSGVLDGLDVGVVGLESALVSTPGGIVVVSGSHDGHPAVYAPGHGGRYRWYVNESVPQLLPITAWWAGGEVRALGHRCGAGTRSPSPAGVACGAEPLVGVSFSFDALQWSSGSDTFEPTGFEIDTAGAVGNGDTVIAPIATSDADSEKRAEGLSAFMCRHSVCIGGLARIDLEDGSVTRLKGEAPSPLVCPSAGTFLVGATTIEPSKIIRIDPDTGARTTTDTTGTPRAVGVVEGDRIEPVPIDVSGPSGDGRAAGVGCAEGGLLVSTSDDDHRALITMAGSAGTPLTTKRAPAAPLGGGSESYHSDLTGTALVASIEKQGSGKSYVVAVWDSAARSWKRLDGSLPSPEVAVAQDGTVFAIDRSRDGSATLHLIH